MTRPGKRLGIAAIVIALAMSPVAHAAEGRAIHNEAAAQDASDANLRRKVKKELTMTPDVNAANINVNTTGGIVKLTGTVESKSQKDKAITTTRRVGGVKAIKDNLVLHGEMGE